MTPLQENQTRKEATRTRKEEKEEPAHEDSRCKEGKEPRETQQEGHEPDTLGRLIGAWMDAEDEHWNKTSPREDKRTTKRTTRNNRNIRTRRADRMGGKRKMPNEAVHSGTKNSTEQCRRSRQQQQQPTRETSTNPEKMPSRKTRHEKQRSHQN